MGTALVCVETPIFFIFLNNRCLLVNSAPLSAIGPILCLAIPIGHLPSACPIIPLAEVLLEYPRSVSLIVIRDKMFVYT